MNPQLLNNTDFQNKKSIYINQILDNANNMYVNTQIIITMIFSSIINAVIFCIGISPIYLIALIFVIIGTAYQIKFSIKKRRSIAINLQSIDAKVHTSLLSGWITTIVGNRVNFSK
ncbi:hypothetical protein FACS189459_1580 [Bacilli bacterium]|nr:hypothetical protein FACS189459_1580 [Bacilli bacterium]